MGRARSGNPAENLCARLGRELGYFVSSTRHIGGAGDQLWTPPRLEFGGSVLPYLRLDPLLIEVKATTTVPWASSNFGREKRQAMKLAGREFGFEPILFWKPPGRVGPFWIPADEWPDGV